MTRTRAVILTAIAVAIIASALSGCTKPKPAATTPAKVTTSGTAVSTASTEPTTIVVSQATGPITTPPTGSAERTALLDAARANLGTTSQFYVYQLLEQGDTAFGDVQTVSGDKRHFVAWKKAPSGWAVVWTTPFGSAAASKGGAAAALTGFSAELLGKVDWKLKPPASSATMKASLAVEAKKWSMSVMSGKGSPYAITLCKVAQDTNGAWWGHVVTQPASDASNSYEPLNFWAKYSGGGWSGAVQDPEPPDPKTYFPASVIGSLSLQ